MPVPTSINYGQVAVGYDKSRRIEPAISSALIAGLRSLNARSVLEIGAGTGNYSASIVASYDSAHAEVGDCVAITAG
jgi:protein-L-isoaspartate O-methyltransferase